MISVNSFKEIKNRNKRKRQILFIKNKRKSKGSAESCLRPFYHILKSSNNAEGLLKAQNHNPDLILINTNLPKRNGFELCRILKDDDETCHIPIILLISDISPESVIKGLQAGADACMTEPLNPKELHARIKNLIEIRQKLFSRLNHFVTPQPMTNTMPSMNQLFLQKAMEVVEDHLAEESFDVETLASGIGLSYTQIHRKLRALTGQSTTQFIKSIRLQHAYQLIQQNSASITEIAYTVGFSNPAYFARCFKQQYGILPSMLKKSSKHSKD